MQSQLKNKSINETKYDFDYDFDYASQCWKENKKYIGNGCYKYINKCQGVTKKGKKCMRYALKMKHYVKYIYIKLN